MSARIFVRIEQASVTFDAVYSLPCDYAALSSVLRSELTLQAKACVHIWLISGAYTVRLNHHNFVCLRDGDCLVARVAECSKPCADDLPLLVTPNRLTSGQRALISPPQAPQRPSGWHLFTSPWGPATSSSSASASAAVGHHQQRAFASWPQWPETSIFATPMPVRPELPARPSATTQNSGLVVATYNWGNSLPCGHADQVAAVLASSDKTGCFDSTSAVRIHAHNVVSHNSSILSIHILQALQHIAQRPHIRIVNLSWGEIGAYNDTQVHTQMKQMSENGMVFIAAAGNSGPSPHTITAPAHLPFVIAVGSAQVASRILLQSSRGPPPLEAGLGDIVKPDCVALAPLVPNWPNLECIRSSGTSFTAPRVASFIAAAMSVEPNRQFHGSAWMQIIHAAGRPVPGGSGWQQGAGLVTRARVLEAAAAHEPKLSIWPPRIAFNGTSRRVVLLQSLPNRHCESPTFGDLQSDEVHFARDLSLAPSAAPWIDIATSCGEVRVLTRSLQSVKYEDQNLPDLVPFVVASVMLILLLLIATAKRTVRTFKKN